MRDRRFNEKEIIIIQKMYHVSGKKAVSIAKLYGCSIETVHYYIHEYPKRYKSIRRKNRKKNVFLTENKKNRSVRDKSVNEVFAGYIKKNLTAIRLSPAEFARAIRVSRQLVYNWVEGSFLPNERNQNRIFRFFKTDHHSLEDVINDSRYNKK